MNKIFEELKDIDKTPLNIHWTNPHNLYGILKDGYIKGNKYNTSLSDYSKSEVATLRRSIDKGFTNLQRNRTSFEAGVSKLSGNIEGIKIYLFTNRIKSAVKSVKKYPIAELSLMDIKAFERQVRYVYDNIFKGEEDPLPFKEFTEFFKKNGNKVLKNIDDDTDIRRNRVIIDRMNNRILKKYGVDPSESETADWYVRLALVSLVKMRKIKREGEERFSYDEEKTKGIPVKPEFMKIRFMKVDERKVNDYMKLAPYMKQNKNLFIIDRNYQKILDIVGKEGN